MAEKLPADLMAEIERLKLDALADFAAGAGHEINNPLAVIAGRAQLLLRDETEPERRQTLALIRAQAMRVHEMIADLMLFARPPEPKPERIDLSALLDRVLAEAAAEADLGACERMGTGSEPVSENAARIASCEVPAPIIPQAPTARVELVRTDAGQPLEIDADPTQLAVALRSIVRNAIEAVAGITGSGRVEAAIARRGDEAVIEVNDDGPGISAEEREHIFNPFSAGRQAGRGLGLGLSKAWRIVVGHGGRIEVGGRKQGGASFAVHLPLSPPRRADCVR